MPFKSTLIGAFAACLFAAPAFADIEIHDQFARSSNAMAGAAFMVIHNHGDSDDHLLGVASDAAARVELHTHRENADGVMQMLHLEDGVAIPAGGEIILQRGGNHVMFMGLTDPFEQDDIVTITFTFEHAGDVTVQVPVDQDHADSTETDADSDHSHSDSDG